MSTKHQYKAHKTLASEDHYFYSRMLKFTMCGTTSTHCCIKLKFYHIRFTRCCSNRMIREYKKKLCGGQGLPGIYKSILQLHVYTFCQTELYSVYLPGWGGTIETVGLATTWPRERERGVELCVHSIEINLIPYSVLVALLHKSNYTLRLDFPDP